MYQKSTYLFCKFLHTEMKKIDEDKWYHGLIISADPGESFVIDWVQRNASNWRKEWEDSACQHCKHWKICGHRVRKYCNDFEFDEEELDD